MNFKITALVLLIIGGSVTSWYLLNEKNQSKTNEKEILFRVKVSAVNLENNSLIAGKQSTDFVEIKLPGQLYDPPKQFTTVSKEEANWNTPSDAAIADFSAFKADDDNWIIETFAPDEQKDIQALLNNKDARESNKKMFESRIERSIIGEVKYKEFVIIFTRDTEQSHPVPLTFKQTTTGWKRTNALSQDETFDIIFSALYNEGEIMVIE